MISIARSKGEKKRPPNEPFRVAPCAYSFLFFSVPMARFRRGDERERMSRSDKGKQRRESER